MIHNYVNVNHIVTPLLMRMPWCFTYKLEGSKQIGIKYFKDADVNNKVILEFYI